MQTNKWLWCDQQLYKWVVQASLCHVRHFGFPFVSNMATKTRFFRESHVPTNNWNQLHRASAWWILMEDASKVIHAVWECGCSVGHVTQPLLLRKSQSASPPEEGRKRAIIGARSVMCWKECAPCHFWDVFSSLKSENFPGRGIISGFVWGTTTWGVTEDFCCALLVEFWRL